jgi:hypothetical protein
MAAIIGNHEACAVEEGTVQITQRIARDAAQSLEGEGLLVYEEGPEAG